MTYVLTYIKTGDEIGPAMKIQTPEGRNFFLLSTKEE